MHVYFRNPCRGPRHNTRHPRDAGGLAWQSTAWISQQESSPHRHCHSSFSRSLALLENELLSSYMNRLIYFRHVAPVQVVLSIFRVTQKKRHIVVILQSTRTIAHIYLLFASQTHIYTAEPCLQFTLQCYT